MDLGATNTLVAWFLGPSTSGGLGTHGLWRHFYLPGTTQNGSKPDDETLGLAARSDQEREAAVVRYTGVGTNHWRWQEHKPGVSVVYWPIASIHGDCLAFATDP